MGAPKGSSRRGQRIGRANNRLDEPSEAILIPGNRFEYLEARAALDAVEAGERDPDIFRPGGLDVLAQHIMRSEEHTSELQSLMRISYAVFCLKKKKRDRTRKRGTNLTYLQSNANITEHNKYIHVYNEL